MSGFEVPAMPYWEHSGDLEGCSLIGVEALEDWGRECANLAQQQAKRAEDAEAQRQHDYDADTACRNLLCEERDIAEAERDALAARVRVLTEALETLASNFNAAGNPPQPWSDMIDSWHYIARAALRSESEGK